MFRRYLLIFFIIFYLAGCSSDQQCVMKVGGQQLPLRLALDAFQKSSPNYKQTVMTDSAARSFCEIRFARNMFYLQEADHLNIIKDDSIAAVIHDHELQVLTRVHGPLFKKVTEKIQSPDEQRLKELYDKRMWEYKVSHILVGSKTLADSLARAIEKGANFAELAKAYSFDNRLADDKGLWKEWFLYGTMAGDFDDLVLRMPPGIPAGPVRSRYGYHLIIVVERKPRNDLPYEKINARMENLYNSLAQTRTWLRYQHRLPEKYDFAVDAAAVQIIRKIFHNDEQGLNRLNTASLTPQQNNMILAGFKGGVVTIGQFVAYYNTHGPFLLPAMNRRDYVEAYAETVAMDELLYLDAISMGLDSDVDYRKDAVAFRNKVLVTEVFRRMYQPFTITEEDIQAKYQSESRYQKAPYEEILPYVHRAVTTDKEGAEETRQLNILKGKYQLEFCKSGLRRLVAEMNKIVQQQAMVGTQE